MKRLTLSPFRALGLVCALVCVAMPAHAQGPDAKLDSVLQWRARQLAGRSRVIVQFRGQPDARVITRRGGVAGRSLAQVRAQVAELDNRMLLAIAGDPQVQNVYFDREAFPTLERATAAIGATVARREFKVTGRGIGVAIIDSGVAALHDDLYLANPAAPRVSPRVAHFKDFTVTPRPGVWLSEQPRDDFGHGTHVAGIIAGNGYDSRGTHAGVAPEARLVALKVLDGEGHGYISDVIAAIDYAIAVRRSYNIRVINLSVASGVFESYRTDPLAQAARRAVEAGIVVVAAAGNLGTDADGEPQHGGITSPGNAPWVLTVGATNHQGTSQRSDDSVAHFSSRGPTWLDFAAKPDIVAPGVGIESLAAPNSLLYSRYADYLVAGSGVRSPSFKPYLSLSGTSMAAPVVSGTVALMLQENPKLTPNAVKALLQYTAQVRQDEDPLTQGAGMLNARGAIRMARFFAYPRRGVPRPFDPIAGEPVAWSRQVLWGNVLVDGGLPLPGSNAWGTSVLWGSAVTASGAPVVWGVHADDNIVWSTFDDNIVWSTHADNIVWSTHDDNIVWSTFEDNIVWSTAHTQNVVWGNDCGGANCTRTVWGAQEPDGTVWGTGDGDDNIVWSTFDDNIVWSTSGDNIAWSTVTDNIVWSTFDDNIVWSTGEDNIVWSTTGAHPVLWAASPNSSGR